MGIPSKAKISIRNEREGGQETGLVGLVGGFSENTEKDKIC